MKTINPYDLKKIRDYPELSDDELKYRINRAQRAFESHRKVSFEERSRKMKLLAKKLREDVKHYAVTITTEMGKPIREARAEVEKCAWVCEYYADNAEDFLKNKKLKSDADKSFLAYRPLGVILAVMPWNFPFWQVFRFAAPAVMAGNTALLKHAPNVQGCATLIQQLFEDSGFRKGTLQNLCIETERVEAVIAHKVVKAVTLTGSERAGSAVASQAGRNIKKTVLELGGSNAFIVLEDASLKKAAKLGYTARMINNAQSCIAAKRFIIVGEERSKEFIKHYKSHLKEVVMGNPIEETTTLGPLARVDLAEKVESQVKESLEQGAELVRGGKREEAFYEATLLSNVRPGMPAFDEEVFGPVAAVITARDEQEAFELANRSRYGLGVTVISKSPERAEEWSAMVEDGALFVNEMVKSDPRLPFGGTKNSGYGRELSRLGIREFVNAQTVYVRDKL